MDFLQFRIFCAQDFFPAFDVILYLFTEAFGIRKGPLSPDPFDKIDPQVLAQEIAVKTS